MPNTVVKLTNAESTWLEAAWEDKKLLVNKSVNHWVGAFSFIHLWVYGFYFPGFLLMIK
jgi:hypothetical protein